MSRKSVSYKLAQAYKKLDFFGHPVTISYKGRATYNTIVGATLSILFFTFLTLSTLDELVRISRYENPDVNQFLKY